MVLNFFCLTCSTWCDILKIHSPCPKWQAVFHLFLWTSGIPLASLHLEHPRLTKESASPTPCVLVSQRQCWSEIRRAEAPAAALLGVPDPPCSANLRLVCRCVSNTPSLMEVF